MVLADGVIDCRELELLYRIGIENYGFSPEEIASCIKESGTSFILPSRLDEKIELLYQIARICVCDDDIDEAEINLFNRYALSMGFEKENIDGIREYLIEEAMHDTPQATVVAKIINS